MMLRLILILAVLHFFVPSVQGSKPSVPIEVKINYQKELLPTRHLPITLEFRPLEPLAGDQLRIRFSTTGKDSLEEIPLLEFTKPSVMVNETWRYQGFLESVSPGIARLAGGVRLETVDARGKPISWAGKMDILYVYTNEKGEIFKISSEYPKEWQEYDWLSSTDNDNQILKLAIDTNGIKVSGNRQSAWGRSVLDSFKWFIIGLFIKLSNLLITTSTEG